MAVDKRLSLTYALTNLFFIASGAVTVAISVIWKADAINDPSHIPVLLVLTVSRRTYRTTYHLPHDANDHRSCCRYRHTDRRLILITTYSPFSIVLMVALVMPSSRGWLHIHSWLCVVASLSLLIVGLKIWTLTLDEKNNIFAAYNLTSTTTIEALQERVSSWFLAHPNDSIIVAASSTVALLIS